MILLRGNGSPRTFRLSLPALQRSLTALGFLFATAVAAALFFLALNLFRSGAERIAELPAPVVAPVPVAPPSSLVSESTLPVSERKGLWQKFTGPSPGSAAGVDPELQKQVQGLQEDIAKLNAQLDGRTALNRGENRGLLQFFGPRNVAVPENSSPMRVKNGKVAHDQNGKTIYVDFELHNVDPDQRQARGYIVVLAKTKSYLSVYPENVFSPTQNIVLDYTKGETFAVSRFRQARAAFLAAPLEGKGASYQVLLFATDGKVVADLHVEDAP